MNGLKNVSSLLKGRGHGETHVTLIQEKSGQWEVLFSMNFLWILDCLWKSALWQTRVYDPTHLVMIIFTDEHHVCVFWSVN